MNTVAAHQRVMRPVPHTTSGAGLAVIASLLLELAGASMAAPPPDRRASRPLVFEANRGQADAQVQFVARGAGYTAFLTSTETVLQLGAHATVHLKPVGVDPAARILGDGELPGVVNYFRQNSSTAINAPYLGGTGDEARVSLDGEVHLARDGAGNVYLTGTTRSTDFPTTAGAYRMLGGSADVFVTKLSPAGAVLYSTYLGGPCEDYARDIAVDGAGNAYVTGEVNGGGTCVSDPGVLVAKLDANGSLVYATRLGGSLLDSSYGTGIAVDGEGHAYVTGVAITSDFPTTPGAYRTTACPNVYPFAADGFVAKLSADGSAL